MNIVNGKSFTKHSMWFRLLYFFLHLLRPQETELWLLFQMEIMILTCLQADV